jgi:flavin-binding protein dodecin
MDATKTVEYRGNSMESIEDAVNNALAQAKSSKYSHYEILETLGLSQEQQQTQYQATVKVFL